MINMYNARAFLEEGRFVPAAQVGEEKGGRLSNRVFRCHDERGLVMTRALGQPWSINMTPL